ncbi:acyl-CoA thioesterase [bacterium]|nr:acyl-CoA thioesterase [bacterium]MBU1917865.1 acyl-CoA thioesterase [bacterium]
MNSKYNINTKVTVRFSDTDAMGHLNNAKIFSYMEEGRVTYFKNVFPDQDLAKHFDVFPFIIAQIQAEFKSPAYCGETLVVSLGITKFGTKSFTMEYDITEEKTGRPVATGSSILVMFDYKTQKTFPIPDEFKAKIQLIEK